ncbi:SNARE domain-containing protein [Xylaria intraflava]|nr:SNARE domain-containing protein [Xylaria intraflava]
MMSSTNEEDPFLQVQQDVLAQMQTARPLFASYLRIRSLSSTPAQSPEVASARSDLESALSTLAEDLADLVESVRAVESDPSHYGLSAHEVSRRKKLVDEVGGEIEDMREELARQNATLALSSSTSGPLGSRAAAAARTAANEDLPPPSAFALDETGSAQGDDNYAEFEHQQQLQMMRDQDQQLDGVFVTVGNLRRQADDMGRELEEQHEMLEHVDTLADRVGGRLQTGMQKLGHVIQRGEDRYSSCCIALLITVLIILLVLLLVL